MFDFKYQFQNVISVVSNSNVLNAVIYCSNFNQEFIKNNLSNNALRLQEKVKLGNILSNFRSYSLMSVGLAEQ